MRRFFLTAALAFLAGAVFGLEEFDATFTDPEAQTVTQAGAHPFAMKTSLRFLV